MQSVYNNPNNPNRSSNMLGANRSIGDKVVIEWQNGKKQTVTIAAKHFNIIHNEWVYKVLELQKNILESNII